MSSIEKAAQAAAEAQANTEQTALILAVLQAQQLMQQQAPTPAAPAPLQQPNTGKWIALAVACPFLAVTLAISAVAFAISVVALTICVLVLRGMWSEYQQSQREG